MKIRPRLQYDVSLVTGAILMLLVGFGFHFAAQRTQRRNLERALAALESRVDSLEASSSTPPPAAPPVASSQDLPDELQTTLFPPRILGHGRTGNWRYMDVRLPDGDVRRYYLRAGSSPRESHAWVQGIIADVEDCRISAQCKSVVP